METHTRQMGGFTWHLWGSYVGGTVAEDVAERLAADKGHAGTGSTPEDVIVVCHDNIDDVYYR